MGTFHTKGIPWRRNVAHTFCRFYQAWSTQNRQAFEYVTFIEMAESRSHEELATVVEATEEAISAVNKALQKVKTGLHSVKVLH